MKNPLKNTEPVKKKRKKYQVLFVPHYGNVREWRGRRLTARRNGKDEFTFKQAQTIKRFLEKRGDKAIEIK